MDNAGVVAIAGKWMHPAQSIADPKESVMNTFSKKLLRFYNINALYHITYIFSFDHVFYTINTDLAGGGRRYLWLI